MGRLIQSKQPCGECGSSDALEIYDDGSYCYSCEKSFPPDGSLNINRDVASKELKPLLHQDEIDYKDLNKRKLSAEACEEYLYGVANYKGRTVQVAQYKDEKGKVVAQKLRFADKTFLWLGNHNKATFFGVQNIQSGKTQASFKTTLVITEGELDAISVRLAMGTRMHVVSIPDGAGATKVGNFIKRQTKLLDKFDKVILCFDNDEKGIEAANVAAQYIQNPYIVKLPRKDANDMLVAGEIQELTTAIYSAEKWKPEVIKSVADLMEGIDKPMEMGLPYPYKLMTDKTYGIRRGELIGFGAGTGVGKSELFKELLTHMVKVNQQPVGGIFLEESVQYTLRQLIGKQLNTRLHVPTGEDFSEDLKTKIRGEAEAFNDMVYFYDNFGGTDWADVKSYIRYLHNSHGVNYFYLDHLTALSAKADDEKKLLEQVMEELASLCKSLNVTVFYVSHLTTPEGRTHEEGGRVTIRHFKGSRAIGFWTFIMFGLERNQQAEDEEERNTTIIRGLKDRFTGEAVGMQMRLFYDKDKGKLLELDEKPSFPPVEEANAKGEEEDEF